MRSLKHRLVHRSILYAKKLRSSNDISRYIKNGGLLRLNLGAQSNRADGWLNVDIAPGMDGVYLDATNMAAVPDDRGNYAHCCRRGQRSERIPA